MATSDNSFFPKRGAPCYELEPFNRRVYRKFKDFIVGLGCLLSVFLCLPFLISVAVTIYGVSNKLVPSSTWAEINGVFLELFLPLAGIGLCVMGLWLLIFILND